MENGKIRDTPKPRLPNKLKHIDKQRFVNDFSRVKSSPAPNNDVDTEYTTVDNAAPNPHPMHTASGLQQNPGLQRPLYTSGRLPEQFLASNDHGVWYHREYRSTPQQDILTFSASSQEQFSEAGPSRPVAYPVCSVPMEYQPSFGSNAIDFETRPDEMESHNPEVNHTQAGLAYHGDFLQNQHADREGYPTGFAYYGGSLPNQRVDQFQTETAQGYGHAHSQYAPEDLLTRPENFSLNISHVTNGQGPFDPSGYPYLVQRQRSAQGYYYAQETDSDNQGFSNIYYPTIYGSK